MGKLKDCKVKWPAHINLASERRKRDSKTLSQTLNYSPACLAYGRHHAGYFTNSSDNPQNNPHLAHEKTKPESGKTTCKNDTHSKQYIQDLELLVQMTYQLRKTKQKRNAQGRLAMSNSQRAGKLYSIQLLIESLLSSFNHLWFKGVLLAGFLNYCIFFCNHPLNAILKHSSEPGVLKTHGLVLLNLEFLLTRVNY